MENWESAITMTLQKIIIVTGRQKDGQVKRERVLEDCSVRVKAKRP